MKVQQFLQHHGIARNPFAEEDAQSDPVFKDHCINDTYHPAWDKIFGEPNEPATSIVFGEKGAGKTAMRLQIARHLDQYNRAHPTKRLFIIHYDDFNPFLDHFMNRMPTRRRRIDKALSTWRLWDHMDAILSLGVTSLVDKVLALKRGEGTGGDLTVESLAKLDRHQRRDLLTLAACYDQSTAQPFTQRWNKLRRKLRLWALKARVPFCLGVTITLVVVAVAIALFFLAGSSDNAQQLWDQTPVWVYFVVALAGWLPWAWKFGTRCTLANSIVRHVRVSERRTNQLRKVLMRLTSNELAGQPLPNKDRTDDRYELLSKFQGILQAIGYGGVYVLVDRVDEPYLINGSTDLMKALVWPMLDNKFLKNPGMGVKMMLPAELKYYVEREDRDFVQRARLDKQNMVPSLAWTGEALFDVANARIRACAGNGKSTKISELFDESVTQERLLDGFRSLRVPRHLHKFLYRLLVAHCNAHTDDDPQWKISRERFEAELALYQRDASAIDG